MASYTQLKSIVENTEKDADKFFNGGNKAAGTRLRKNLQQIKVLAQELRQEVTKQKQNSK